MPHVQQTDDCSAERALLHCGVADKIVEYSGRTVAGKE